MTEIKYLIILCVSALAGSSAVVEDFTSRRTSAVQPQDPGEFTRDGWRVTTERCQLKWDLGRHYPRGTVEFEVKGPLKQEAKRSLFSAWNEEAAADGDRKTQGFFQLRVMQDGMMLRLSYRPGGRSFEGYTGALDWDENRWYRMRGQWDTEGGLSQLWRDGELISTGRFNQPFEGFRWVFIGKDNYQKFVSIPGVTYHNLKVTVEGPTEDPPLELYFPPPGEGFDVQSRVTPEEAGFDPAVITALEDLAPRWALWRNGRLVHVKGDFNQTSNVASNRKTWHALTVGAGIQQGKIASLNDRIQDKATWWHVITQSAGFDYPYGDHPAYPPGRMWTYSDYNPVALCNALARAWGRKDYYDDYPAVLKDAYFDAIGMRGWSTAHNTGRGAQGPDDGIRLILDLEDMGRLGLLVLARGNWNGKQLVPAWFVHQVERKQTYGMLVNYEGPNDGMIGLDPKEFPECPYGLMTWVNTDGDLIQGADRRWAMARGAGGHVTLWNRRFGIVFAAAGAEDRTGAATILEKHLRDNKPSAIHLAWVEDPSTTMTIVWHTGSRDADSVVEYRPAGTDEWQRAQGAERPTGAPGKVHEVTLRSLAPSTRYEYRVAGGDVHTTKTAPAGSAPFEAIFVADTGMIGREDGLGTGVEQVIAEIGKMDPLVVLLGGDYAYFNTDRRWGTLDKTILGWFEQMKPIAVNAPMMPTYGNHEIFLREGYLFWAEHFPTPEGFDNRRYYSFDVGDAHFVSILAANSERGPLAQSAIDWIDRDMAAARHAGKKWIIPFLHVAPFSDGSNHPSNEDLRRQVGPVFERNSVKVALTCHDQSYERTYPLRGVPDEIEITSQAKNCYAMDDGVSYLKVSPGGKISNINKSFATFKTNPPPRWTAFRDNTHHHFAKLAISPDELRVDVYGLKGDGSPLIIQDTVRYSGTCPQ